MKERIYMLGTLQQPRDYFAKYVEIGIEMAGHRSLNLES